MSWRCFKGSRSCSALCKITWIESVPLKRPWSCRRRKEEDEVAAASSSDTNVEENPEDDWFGSITQAPSARARTF
jgi:hypothetical protein